MRLEKCCFSLLTESSLILLFVTLKLLIPSFPLSPPALVGILLAFDKDVTRAGAAFPTGTH